MTLKQVDTEANPRYYYIGTCHTGAGGSLGAMLAFLGRQSVIHSGARLALMPLMYKSFSTRVYEPLACRSIRSILWFQL